MADYKEMYFTLFNGLTDIIEALKKLQQLCEDLYISSDDSSSQKETPLGLSAEDKEI